MSLVGLCQCGCGQPTKLATDTVPSEGRVKGQPLRFIKGHNQRRHKASEATRAKLRAVAARRAPISEETRERQRASAQRRDNTNLRITASSQKRTGADGRNWKGGRRLSSTGYVQVFIGGTAKYELEHVMVVETALGHELPVGAVIHHHNQKKTDNRGCNLVVCQDDAYHVELHRKIRVLRAGGNPWTDRLCFRCKTAKPAAVFYGQRDHVSPYNPLGYSSICAPCGRERRRERTAA